MKTEKFEIKKEFKPYKTIKGFGKKAGRKRKTRTPLYFILKDLDMSQMDLAELADLELGQVSLLVRGHFRDITMNTAKRVCNAVQRTLDEVWGDK